ncbi:ABC transporter ATP-binding protein [Acidilutibacter cellobiosedens]|uniref:ABC transporter ATP-binding protein n=1 Tax=Acidilutibacter cellobiosedens TaxID=2507161 RepID=A0A410QEF3_9FIRM|nr:ABC transporter ATP-binding protein [Acidilutibacter cellobiosedens]QAT62367.1 ABC transporter ATP-binding protein [Acidilutibacter cellobiosedens]
MIINVWKNFNRVKIKNIIYFILCMVLECIIIYRTFILGRYIDALIQMDKQYIYDFTVKFIVLLLLSIIITYFLRILSTMIINDVEYSIKNQVYEHLMKVPNKNIVKDSAHLVSQIDTDCKTVSNFTVNRVISISDAIFKSVVILYIMINTDVGISLMIISIISLSAIIYFLLKKLIYKKYLSLVEEENKYFSFQNKYLRFKETIARNSWYELFSKKFASRYKNKYRKTLEFVHIDTMYSQLINVMTNICTIILIFYGGLRIINHEMTLGDFTILNNYQSTLLQALVVIFSFGSEYQKALVSYNRLKEIFNIEENKDGIVNIQSVDSIKICELSYKIENNVLFENVNINLEKGNIYCISGKNGTGKSTILDILSGVNYDYKGNIYYNGIDIKDISVTDTRKYNLSFLEQEPVLISNDLYENLTLGLDNVDRNKILDLFNELFEKPMEEFCKREDASLQDELKMSGGEKQKVSLIRALYKPADVMLLDEPTSALDSKSKIKLINILNRCKKEKIIIIITHDRDLLSVADKTFNFDDNFLSESHENRKAVFS